MNSTYMVTAWSVVNEKQAIDIYHHLSDVWGRAPYTQESGYQIRQKFWKKYQKQTKLKKLT